jgi:hypothetical protein
MKTEDQRIAIAEACGWKPSLVGRETELWKHRSVEVDRDGLPDYLSDLNAMHEAEKMLTDAQMSAYERELGALTCRLSMVDGPGYKLWHATAPQRAEAFLRTLGLWKEAA